MTFDFQTIRILPETVVLAPEALLIALLENDPVIGIERKNDPAILLAPRASNSWVASTILPLAATKRFKSKIFALSVVLHTECFNYRNMF